MEIPMCNLLDQSYMLTMTLSVAVCTYMAVYLCGMKVIRHAGVDSRMIILDDQACQQMTRHF